MIHLTHLDLKEVCVLNYDTKEDNRGIGYRLFSKRQLEEVGIYTEFVEEILNCPSKKGTLYGIHFQNHPRVQNKLLFCIKGRGFDFAVDLRRNSATYKKWVSVELSAQNRKQIYIPAGFGHAFLSLEDETQVVMQIDNYFDAALSRTVTYADRDLNIAFNILNPILSEGDKNAPTLMNSDCNL
ncbi:dTDP-4-dehydrorhamnose 3,5-epimerase [Propionispira arboris]|uniref:dTDP-4-dehydrorhamnose 3,5-epimerase n=1 Tax=Propionispira arboris TaxID=84035 RepID=A0A1H7AVQ2_9FIRM|nr:dTDP-4-dehydrorhamnose 3,5-epimerase [Propionispira arboris]SEJ69368.1 dTDP-4-dehydrorhamnose 3,5-epimerase [Propionispira arboris]